MLLLMTVTITLINRVVFVNKIGILIYWVICTRIGLFKPYLPYMKRKYAHRVIITRQIFKHARNDYIQYQDNNCIVLV